MGRDIPTLDRISTPMFKHLPHKSKRRLLVT